MPKALTSEGSAAFASLLASSGLTSRVRALTSDIREACKSANAQDWSEDLSGLGITIPESDEDREKFRKSLAGAFGAVANETDKQTKRAARVAFLATGEVAVSFRVVKQRSK